MLAFVGSTARSLGPLKSSPPSKLPIVTLLAATICAVDTVVEPTPVGLSGS